MISVFTKWTVAIISCGLLSGPPQLCQQPGPGTGTVLQYSAGHCLLADGSVNPRSGAGSWAGTAGRAGGGDADGTGGGGGGA